MSDIARLAFGYAAARPFAPTSWFVDAELPARVVTVSHCLAAVGPGPWAHAWGEDSDQRRRADAEAMGVAPASLPELHRWLAAAMERGDWRWPRWFATREAAAEFVDRFCAADDVLLLGIGVSERVGAELGRPEPLATGGELLGHEILGIKFDDFCSWHCNNLEPVVRRELGIHANEHGLIADAPDAEAAATLIDDPKTGAEPVPWFPAALVAYPPFRGGR